MNKHWEFINRHGDHDKHWWRFRYSAPSAHWRPTGVMLETNGGGYDESQRTFNLLNVSVRGHTLGLILPAIVMPFYRARSYTPDGHDEPRTYSEVISREFGFRIVENAVHFHYGEQTHEWPGSKSKCWFIPWRETDHIRHTLYDTDGQFYADMPEGRSLGIQGNGWKVRNVLEWACPHKLFLFAEADGDMRIAVCQISEREWRHGRGIWRWLLAWKRHLVIRSLTIEYSHETGRRKGSWKGGTIGTSIEMVADETPREAFRRHCEKNALTFIGDVTRPETHHEDLRGLAKLYMDEIASGMTAAFCEVRKKIYRAGLTPIFDTVANKTRAYPGRTVNAALHGVVLPDAGPDHLHVPAFDKAEVSGMMADGQVEGQWGSPMVIKEVSDEEFERMVQGAAADGTINAAMHEEFEARGLDTAFIPARPHPEQEEMAERVRSVMDNDARKCKGAGDGVSGD